MEMRIEKDYEELLGLLNKHKVKYCIVGAYAVAFHKKPRYTKDIDIFVEPSVENGKKIVDALNEFGFESLHLSENDFAEKGRIIQLGYEPVRVDIITEIAGVLRSTEPMADQFAQRVQERMGEPVPHDEILAAMKKISAKTLSMDKVIAKIEQQRNLQRAKEQRNLEKAKAKT